jgi:hypothetical protein
MEHRSNSRSISGSMSGSMFWLAVIVALLALACGGEQKPAGSDGKLLVDPGFEGDGEAWAYVGEYRLGLFRVSDAIAHSGAQSGHLFLDSRVVPPVTPTRAASALQEPAPEAFPESLSGWYRAERWDHPSDDTTGLTLNVVVYAMGDPRTMEIVRPADPNAGPPPARLPGYGIRYRLAGQPSRSQRLAEEQTVAWGNVADREIGSGDPPLGEWVRFELPIRADFEAMWKVVPADYQNLRIILQALWMDRVAGEDVIADVYIDDLELSPGS